MVSINFLEELISGWHFLHRLRWKIHGPVGPLLNLSQQPALKATLSPDILPRLERCRLYHKPTVGKRNLCVTILEWHSFWNDSEIEFPARVCMSASVLKYFVIKSLHFVKIFVTLWNKKLLHFLRGSQWSSLLAVKRS